MRNTFAYKNRADISTNLSAVRREILKAIEEGRYEDIWPKSPPLYTGKQYKALNSLYIYRNIPKKKMALAMDSFSTYLGVEKPEMLKKAVLKGWKQL